MVHCVFSVVLAVPMVIGTCHPLPSSRISDRWLVAVSNSAAQELGYAVVPATCIQMVLMSAFPLPSEKRYSNVCTRPAALFGVTEMTTGACGCGGGAVAHVPITCQPESKPVKPWPRM